MFAQAVLDDLREVIVRTTGKEPVESAARTLDYVAALCTHLIKQQVYDMDAWQQVAPSLSRWLLPSIRSYDLLRDRNAGRNAFMVLSRYDPRDRALVVGPYGTIESDETHWPLAVAAVPEFQKL